MKRWRDPITGDPLTTLEYLSWRIQATVRSPWFIVVFNVITLVMMLHSGWREPWNWFASWMAIMVEWVVGKYMFGQTGRDAVVLREVRGAVKKVENLEELLLKVVESHFPTEDSNE